MPQRILFSVHDGWRGVVRCNRHSQVVPRVLLRTDLVFLRNISITLVCRAAAEMFGPHLITLRFSDAPTRPKFPWPNEPSWRSRKFIHFGILRRPYFNSAQVSPCPTQCEALPRTLHVLRTTHASQPGKAAATNRLLKTGHFHSAQVSAGAWAELNSVLTHCHIEAYDVADSTQPKFLRGPPRRN